MQLEIFPARAKIGRLISAIACYNHAIRTSMVCYRPMRRWSALLVLLIAIAASFLLGDGTRQNLPRPTGYVNDFATVIDAGIKNQLAALCTEVDRKTNAQIVVVTVQTLAGSSIEDYALHLFNEWGIGHKEDNRGLLILLLIGDRKCRIEVGRGFETLFPNERVAKIVAETVPELRLHHYSQALLTSTKTLASDVAQEKHVQLRGLGR